MLFSEFAALAKTKVNDARELLQRRAMNILDHRRQIRDKARRLDRKGNVYYVWPYEAGTTIKVRPSKYNPHMGAKQRAKAAARVQP